MNKLAKINEQFGGADFVKVEKPEYVGRSLTGAIFDMNARIDQTIDALKQIYDIRKVRAGTFATPMCKKKKGNLVVKVGYGKYNHIMDPMLGEQKYANVLDALDYLFQIRSLLRSGGMDDIIEHHLEKLKARTENARNVRAEAKKASKDKEEQKQIENKMDEDKEEKTEADLSVEENVTNTTPDLQVVENSKKAA